jgi:hypothetical protein
VLVPVVLTAAAVYYHLARTTVVEVEQKNLSLARAVAGEVETFLLAPRYVLGTIREAVHHPRGPDGAPGDGAGLDGHVRRLRPDDSPAATCWGSPRKTWRADCR